MNYAVIYYKLGTPPPLSHWFDPGLLLWQHVRESVGSGETRPQTATLCHILANNLHGHRNNHVTFTPSLDVLTVSAPNTIIVVFNLFYYQVKAQLLGLK